MAKKKPDLLEQITGKTNEPKRKARGFNPNSPLEILGHLGKGKELAQQVTAGIEAGSDETETRAAAGKLADVIEELMADVNAPEGPTRKGEQTMDDFIKGEKLKLTLEAGLAMARGFANEGSDGPVTSSHFFKHSVLKEMFDEADVEKMGAYAHIVSTTDPESVEHQSAKMFGHQIIMKAIEKVARKRWEQRVKTKKETH